MRTVSADVFMDKFNSSEDGVLAGLGVKIRAKNIALSDEIAFGAIKMDAKDDTKIVGDFHALRGCFINFTLQGGISLSSANGKIEYKSGLSTISSVDLPSSDQEIYGGAHAGINLFLENSFMSANFGDLIELGANKLVSQNDTCAVNKILLNQILSLNVDEPLERLLLESKILELIYNEFSRLKCPNKNVILDEADKNALQKARQILSKDIKNPPSIKELSKQVRLNEFKLKVGFKSLFGQTPYEFLREERMKRALAMLQGSELNIAEISAATGFKNQSHFSKLFYDYYGTAPKNLMKNRKYYY